jgi:hypothetical protein
MPLSRRNLLNRQFKPTCERLGLEGVTGHWLRHATATLSSSAGVPLGAVQELLGHSPSQITREVYLEAAPSDVKNAVQTVDLILGPKWTQVLNLSESATLLISQFYWDLDGQERGFEPPTPGPELHQAKS